MNAYRKRFLNSPVESFFLFGPRGVGKSLWVGHEFPDAHRIDLLHPDVLKTYLARPEHLRELLDAKPKLLQIVIDEVQKAPELLSVVHSLIENRKSLQFILTGSSSRKLKRSGVDLMAGRAIVKSLHPFMAAELGSDFSLDRAVRYGLLPLVEASLNPQEVLDAYTALYLREEVQMESLVRNVGSFARFLESVSFSHASVLNLSNISRECQVPRKTVESYVEILESLLLSFRISVFTKRAKRELSDHPKFYLFDAGVFRSMRPRGPLDREEEVEGLALEGLVAQHLRAWISYTRGRNELFFWRTRSQSEVDFVVYGEQGLWAIEVKNSKRRPHPQDLRGLKSFSEDYPEGKCALLYRGKDPLKINGILCLPCEEVLRNLKPGKDLF
jgi:predicted AAA+ superfamily ATPase